LIRDTRDDVCKVKGLRTHKYVGCEGEGGMVPCLWGSGGFAPRVRDSCRVTVAGGTCMVL